MIYSRLLSFILFLTSQLFWGCFSLNAQTPSNALPSRNVNGVLRDSLNTPIAGATVSLTSKRDTIKTATNKFGFYGFKDVKSADFMLTIKAIGYGTHNKRYFNNDTKAQLNIPPIRLGVKEERLEAITISRLKGPMIKGDTTEFWAKDYIIRDYARLEDLLRRMEGISIDSDGNVFYNGEPVVKALFNNQTYFKGSVQEAMKELPADIIERIQIIEKDQSGLASKILKTDASAKVMNIVTKADKSAGKMYDMTLEAGTQDRYKGKLAWKNIDGKDQRSYKLAYSQNPLGIKMDVIPGTISKSSLDNRIRTSNPSNETSGRSKNISAGISQNFKLGKLEFTPNYDFTFNRISSSITKNGESYYNQGTMGFESQSKLQRQSQDHNLSTSLYANIGTGIKIDGSFDIGYSKFDKDNFERRLRSGIVNGLEETTNSEKGQEFQYSLKLMNQSTLSKKVSLRNLLYSSLNTDNSEEKNYVDIFADPFKSVADSSVHQSRKKNSTILSTTFINSFIWDKNEFIKWKFNTGLSHRYSLRNIHSYLIENEKIARYDSLLSNYQTESSFGIPISIAPEFSLENGLYFSPTLAVTNQWLNGQSTQTSKISGRFDFLFIPRLAMGFRNTKIGNINIGFAQQASQPDISSLNMNPYYLTPYDIQIGNSNLKNKINRSIDFKYDIFLKKQGLSLSLMSFYTINKRSIISNRSLRLIPEKNVLISEVTFMNMKGGNQIRTNITASKSFKKLNSTITFTGDLMHSDNPYMSEGILENRKSNSQIFNLAFFYSVQKWLDITPELKYSGMQDKNSLAILNGSTYNNNFYANIKLAFYLPKDWGINLDLSQSAYNTTNIMSNTAPMVINANIEKRIFPRKNGILSFVVMDASRENVVTNYMSTNMGYTNLVSNRDSRYFLLQFSYRPEFFGKSKYDKGKGRRGDGSFIE